MINFLLITTILVWPFGQLLSLTSFGTIFRLQLLDLLATLLFVALLFTSRKEILNDRLFKPLALFILAATLSLAINFDSVSLVSLGYLLRFVSYTAFYFAFRFRGVKKYLPFLLTAAILFLVIGLLQYFLLPDVRFLRYLGFDDHYFRLIGSFLDPNFTGLVLAVLVILASWPVRLAPLLALGLTFSRASFFSLVIGLLYLSLVKRQFKILLTIILLALLLYIIPKPFGEGVNLWRTFSITSRLENQKNAFNQFAQKPIFGYGFNTLKQTIDGDIPNLTSGVDNSFLFVLVTTGLLGFTPFLNFLKIALSGIKSPLVKTALVTILVHSLFNNSLFFSWILILFFLLISQNTKEST